MDDPKTPLIALLRALDDDQRDLLAEWSDTSLSYLYALGSCSRKQCRVNKALQIQEATKRLNELYGTPVVTIEELATMCACQD